MDVIDFSKRISQLRKELGLSQKELGKMLGVSNKAVSKWENGESLPKTATMFKLAELLNIDANELLGLTSKEQNSDNNNEINLLRGENEALRLRLESITKRRKKITAAVIAICLSGIVFATAFSVLFSGNENANKAVKDAGKSNTKIVFNNTSYVPANEFERFILSRKELADKKYATYYASDGSESKVLISCFSSSDYVDLKIGAKTYHYVNGTKKHTQISLDSVKEVFLNNRSIGDEGYNNYDYYDYNSNYLYEHQTKRIIDFYNNKGNPVDKSITSEYLGRFSETLCISLNSEYTLSGMKIELGEFFRDDKGKIYFYDYFDTASYYFGEELI